MEAEVAATSIFWGRLSKRRCALALFLVGCIGLVSNALTFGGDPEIHLVFAKHALAGHPLQFNIGDYSSGETSPLYMVALAGIMAVGGVFAAAVSMKVLGVLSLLGLATLLFRETRTILGRGHPLASLLPLALIAMPSSTFQSQLGMENMPFALGMALLQLESIKPQSRARYAVGTFLTAVLFLLRPEAVFLMLFRLVNATTSSKDRVWRTSVVAAGAVACLIIVWVLEYSTGAPLYGAGLARSAIGRFESTPLAFANMRFFSLRPLAFCAYAWPMMLVVVIRWRRLAAIERTGVLCLVAVPLALHFAGILPNFHFSRYSLYLWFPMIHAFVAAVAVASWLPRGSTLLMAIGPLCAGGVEYGLRERLHVSANRRLLSTWAATRPGAIARYSDMLCEIVTCGARPVVVAAHEVQVRLRLDERFIVRSLDGIVDYRFLPYIQPGGIDHVGYFAERNVDIVLDWAVMSHRATAQIREIARRAALAPTRVGTAEYRMIAPSKQGRGQILVRRSDAQGPS